MRAAGRNIVIVLYCKCYPAEPTQTLEEVIDELIVRLNCPEFGGGFILWEDVAHASIEAAIVEACVAAPVPA